MNPKYSRYYTYIKPFLKNKSVQTYSSLVFSLITITFFSLFAIKPTLSTIVSLQKSIVEQKQTLEAVTLKGENLSLGRKNYEAIDENIKISLIGLLPNSTSLPNLINSLNQLAGTYEASFSGLQFQALDLQGPPQRISKSAKLMEIDFTFNSQGSYQELTALLNGLGSLNRLVNIQTVGFNKQEDGPLTMTVQAKAYFFKN